MRRRQFIKMMGASFCAVALSGCEENLSRGSTKRPNILLILTDDQGWGDLSRHGNYYLKTPVMNRLAEQSATFNRFFVSPFCAPTRASLLTGRYALRTGTYGVTRGMEAMRSEEVTIAEILRENGYATGCFGKWHNGSNYPYHPLGQGFERFVGFCGGGLLNYFNPSLESDDKQRRYRGYITDILTDQAIDFITQNQDRPFFCYLPYNAPHSPFQVPDRYFKKYSQFGFDDTTASVYAMIENLDDNLGRLLKVLGQYGLRENTVVIFLSDNGPADWRYNGGMRGKKSTVHEGGVRVPFFIRWPERIKSGKVIYKNGAHIDIAPTLLDMCGIKSADHLKFDGVSLLPLLMNDDPEWPDRMIFSYLHRYQACVRTEQYRLTIDLRKDTYQLFDIIDDPGQRHDLSKRHPELVDQYLKAYQRWRKDVAPEEMEPLPARIGYANWPKVELPAHEALLVTANGKGISYSEPNGWAGDWITNWKSANAYAYWNAELVYSGLYEIAFDYICKAENVGVVMSFQVDGREMQRKITQPYEPEPVFSPDRARRREVPQKQWKRLRIGQLRIEKGLKKLIVKPNQIPGQQAIDLKTLIVERIG